LHLGPPSFQTRFLAQALFSSGYVSASDVAVRAQSSVSPYKRKKSGAFQENEKSFMGDTTDDTDITDDFFHRSKVGRVMQLARGGECAPFFGCIVT
jgi:hypothetical protein